MTLGQGKRRAAHRLSECARRPDRVLARDVDVDDGTPEQLVAESTADDPGVTAVDRVEHSRSDVIHRRAPVGLAPDSVRIPQTSS